MRRKNIKIILLITGTFFLLLTIYLTYQSWRTQTIKKRGQIISATIKSVDCDNGGIVTFEVNGQVITRKISNSDCSIFLNRQDIQVFYYDKYPHDFAFLNEYTLINSIIICSVAATLIIATGLLIKGK